MPVTPPLFLILVVELIDQIAADDEQVVIHEVRRLIAFASA
jgi:hypothetical protein